LFINQWIIVDATNRDLLKSDSAMLAIPELDLVLEHGTLGGVFTTVEGMLTKIHQSLWDTNPFAVGDSTENNHSEDRSILSVS
jgi:zinc finger protein